MNKTDSLEAEMPQEQDMRNMAPPQAPKCTKYYYLLIFICWFAYLSAYIGRLNYSASMVEIIRSTGTTKAQAGLVSSAFFFCYGAGQLINGILSDRYNARWVVFIALCVSATINLCMPIVGIAAMVPLWGVNGIVQSVLWTQLIRAQAKYLPEKYVSKAIVVMSTTVAGGTFFAYGFSALFAYFDAWRGVFILASAVLLAGGITWFVIYHVIEKKLVAIESNQTSEKINMPAKKPSRPVVLAIIFIAVAAIANGLIKDGVTSWVPSILYESFSLESYFSIILTLIIPLISIFGSFFSQMLIKKLKNHFLVIVLIYVLCAVTLLLLLFFYAQNLVLTIMLFSVCALSMAGMTNIFTSAIPLAFRQIGSSGKIAGIINSFCYVGSTLASFVLGYFADVFGWAVVMIILVSAAAVSIVVISSGLSFWKKTILTSLKK